MLLAIKLKAPGLRLKEIGSWWNAPDAAQRPKSSGRVLSAGLVWGLVIYAIGSGLLMIPIVAHFWANSMEGLGLRWGLPAFLALAAGALLLSFVFRPKDAKLKSS